MNRDTMLQENYFVLTGAMGGGKSTILKALKEKNIHCVPEPARQILEEQRSVGGSAVPENDPELFNQLMLSRAIYLFTANSKKKELIIFDRGIPDMIAYAELFGIDPKAYENAAQRYGYNKQVFWFKGWEEIYTTDEERKMDFCMAEEFGERTANIYRELGYEVVQVPLVSVQERVDFIMDYLKGYSS